MLRFAGRAGEMRNAAINPTDVTEVTKNNTLEKRDFAPVSFKNLREVRRNC